MPTSGVRRLVCIISAVILALFASPSLSAGGALAPLGTSAHEPSSARLLGLDGRSTHQMGCSGFVRRWPLSRRVAQLVVAPSLDFDVGQLGAVARMGVGGILFLGNGAVPADLATLLTSLDGAVPGQIRLLAMADEEGGGVQRLEGQVEDFPWPRQLAADMTAPEVEALADEVGKQMGDLGVDVDLAPVLDLDNGAGPDATDPDGLRSFSATPSVAARYGVAFMQGLAAAGVLPVLKHFPGLGGATANTEYSLALTEPLQSLEAGGLQPFEEAIAGGARAVMVSNAEVPGLSSVPASLSAAVITNLLRHQLGFRGLVITDSLSAGAISQSGYTLPEAAVAALAAGADMVLFGSTLTLAQTELISPANVASSVKQVISAVLDAVASGRLSVARIDEAVASVLATKGLCR